MATRKASEATIRAALRAGHPAEIVYWDRGGPPGRGYEANWLAVRDDGKALTGELLRTRFDPADPPYRTDRFRLVFPTRLAGIDKVVSALAGGPFAEEEKPPIGGVTAITISIEAGAAKLARTFYQKVPQALVPLEARLVKLARACEEQGEHSVVERDEDVTS